jgi:uncharacterized membrane protein
MTLSERFQSDYKYLSYLSISLIACVVVFALFVIGVISINGAFMAKDATEFYFISANVVITFAALKVARYTYDKRVQYIHIDTFGVRDRLEQMKTAIFIHHGLAAIPGILSIICLLLFGRYIVMIILIIALVEMIRKYPNEQRITDAVSYR